MAAEFPRGDTPRLPSSSRAPRWLLLLVHAVGATDHVRGSAWRLSSRKETFLGYQVQAEHHDRALRTCYSRPLVVYAGWVVFFRSKCSPACRPLVGSSKTERTDRNHAQSTQGQCVACARESRRGARGYLLGATLFWSNKNTNMPYRHPLGANNKKTIDCPLPPASSRLPRPAPHARRYQSH